MSDENKRGNSFENQDRVNLGTRWLKEKQLKFSQGDETQPCKSHDKDLVIEDMEKTKLDTWTI